MYKIQTSWIRCSIFLENKHKIYHKLNQINQKLLLLVFILETQMRWVNIQDWQNRVLIWAETIYLDKKLETVDGTTSEPCFTLVFTIKNAEPLILPPEDR
jgi:hypothetical protein